MALYQRFEHALVRAGYLAGREGKRARADWARYGKEHDDNFWEVAREDETEDVLEVSWKRKRIL